MRTDEPSLESVCCFSEQNLRLCKRVRDEDTLESLLNVFLRAEVTMSSTSSLMGQS